MTVIASDWHFRAEYNLATHSVRVGIVCPDVWRKTPGGGVERGEVCHPVVDVDMDLICPGERLDPEVYEPVERTDLEALALRVLLSRVFAVPGLAQPSKSRSAAKAEM